MPPSEDMVRQGSKTPLAFHSAEIEFVFNTLESKKAAVSSDDHKVADTAAAYWANFITAGNPNGPGLPAWPPYDQKTAQVIHFDAAAHAGPEQYRGRYECLDAHATSRRPG